MVFVETILINIGRSSPGAGGRSSGGRSSKQRRTEKEKAKKTRKTNQKKKRKEEKKKERNKSPKKRKKEKKKENAGRHNCYGEHHRTRPTATTCTTTQTARERAGARTFSSSCLDGSVTRVGPGRYPQYVAQTTSTTRAKRQTLREGKVPRGSGAQVSDPRHSTRSTLTKRVLIRRTAMTDESATTVAASPLEPAAEPPGETTEAEDLNTEKSR